METSTKNTLSEDELLANLDAGERSFLCTQITDTVVSHVKLSQVDFSDSYLYRVVFSNVIFENVSFRKCTLKKCQFVDCEFIYGSTGGSTENPIYGSINFEDAELSLVAFISEKQEIGVFRSCRFDRARLCLCIFRNLYIDGNFRDCSVKKVQFIKCDLSDSHGIEFDDNDVTETILPKRRRGSFSFTAIAKRILRPRKENNDSRILAFNQLLEYLGNLFLVSGSPKWLHLVKKYTGPSMVLYIALALVFFVKNIFDISAQVLSGKVALQVANMLGEKGAKLMGMPNVNEIPIWQAILGFHQGSSLVVLATTTLALYTIARTVITVKISQSYHEQMLSNITPSKSSYWWLWRVHQIMSILWVFTITVILFDLYGFLFSHVPIPK